MVDKNDIKNEEDSSFHQLSLSNMSDFPTELEEPCSLQYHFDHFFMCYTLKNQFIHYYRYGQRPDCSSKWKDFMWCVRSKRQNKEEEQRMLREKRLEKLEILKKGRNSEEIWTVRTQPVESPPFKKCT